MQLDFIRSGKRVDSAYIESFDGLLRDERLDVHQFVLLAEAQAIMVVGQFENYGWLFLDWLLIT